EAPLSHVRPADGLLFAVEVVEHHPGGEVGPVSDLGAPRHHHADPERHFVADLGIARADDVRVDVAVASDLHAGADLDVVADRRAMSDLDVRGDQAAVPEHDARPADPLLFFVCDEVHQFIPAVKRCCHLENTRSNSSKGMVMCTSPAIVWTIVPPSSPTA